IAPTITIPWIALVPDIRGVCNSVGTFEITSKPRKIASARIVSSMTTVPKWLISAPAPAKPAPPLFGRLRRAYGSFPLQRRQSRHLRYLVASVEPTAHFRSSAGKAGTYLRRLVRSGAGEAGTCALWPAPSSLRRLVASVEPTAHAVTSFRVTHAPAVISSAQSSLSSP